MSRQIVQIRLNDMLNIVESVGHSSLKRSTSVLQTERKFTVSESTPRTNESGFVLVLRSDVDLIIARKSIHERKDFVAGTVIDNLIDERGRKIVLRTSLVDIPIIYTNANTTTFFIDLHRV
jgi:hypothetical protein